MDITIHYEPSIPWHNRHFGDMFYGLSWLGFNPRSTFSRTRISDAPAVLFGTTIYRDVEAAPGNWLLVDRASYGDPDMVSLVWNGHGLRGDHCVPRDWDRSRLEKFSPYFAEQGGGPIRVLCGQTESYSPGWPSLMDWYNSHPEATHFRPHPRGGNPTDLPLHKSWEGVGEAITLNSSVAIEALLHGVPVVTVDDAGMAYDWGRWGTRQRFFEWLAWTQWSWEEIREGAPIAHLFDDDGITRHERTFSEVIEIGGRRRG